MTDNVIDFEIWKQQKSVEIEQQKASLEMDFEVQDYSQIEEVAEQEDYDEMLSGMLIW